MGEPRFLLKTCFRGIFRWGGVVLFCFTFLLPGKTIQAVCEPPVETVRLEEVESTLQTVHLNEEEARPESTDVKVKEENKPRRTPLMAFLRQMVSHLPSSICLYRADLHLISRLGAGPTLV